MWVGPEATYLAGTKSRGGEGVENHNYLPPFLLSMVDFFFSVACFLHLTGLLTDLGILIMGKVKPIS